MSWRDAYTERGIIPQHYVNTKLNSYRVLHGSPVSLDQWAVFYHWMNQAWLNHG